MSSQGWAVLRREPLDHPEPEHRERNDNGIDAGCEIVEDCRKNERNAIAIVISKES
jgi:hypothetical protein